MRHHSTAPTIALVSKNEFEGPTTGILHDSLTGTHDTRAGLCSAVREKQMYHVLI